MHTHKNYSLTKILNHGTDLQFKNNRFYTGQYLEAHHSKVLEDIKILLKSNNINPLSWAPFQGPNLHSLIKGQTGPRNPRKDHTPATKIFKAEHAQTTLLLPGLYMVVYNLRRLWYYWKPGHIHGPQASRTPVDLKIH